uniref:Uncharacterized protein n=1 Tax=Lotharella globosa TaxID=91324 RepID=A0A7S3Z9K1_9EUKA
MEAASLVFLHANQPQRRHFPPQHMALSAPPSSRLRSEGSRRRGGIYPVGVGRAEDTKESESLKTALEQSDFAREFVKNCARRCHASASVSSTAATCCSSKASLFREDPRSFFGSGTKRKARRLGAVLMVDASFIRDSISPRPRPSLS